MALIPADELVNLKPASEVKEVADSAAAILEEYSIAALINNTANTGEHMAFWARPISKELKTKLEGLGYTVKNDQHSADPSNCYIIGGF